MEREWRFLNGFHGDMMGIYEACASQGGNPKSSKLWMTMTLYWGAWWLGDPPWLKNLPYGKLENGDLEVIFHDEYGTSTKKMVIN